MSLAYKCFTNILQSGFKVLSVGTNKILNSGTNNNIVRNIHVLTKPSLENTFGYSVIKQQITWKRESLLTPVTSLLSQVAGFKVKGRIKRRCKDCLVVIRQQRSYIICPTHPRHKQMQMKKRDYKSWILTHATQSKVRPY